MSIKRCIAATVLLLVITVSSGMLSHLLGEKQPSHAEVAAKVEAVPVSVQPPNVEDLLATVSKKLAFSQAEIDAAYDEAKQYFGEWRQALEDSSQLTSRDKVYALRFKVEDAYFAYCLKRGLGFSEIFERILKLKTAMMAAQTAVAQQHIVEDQAAVFNALADHMSESKSLE